MTDEVVRRLKTLVEEHTDSMLYLGGSLDGYQTVNVQYRDVGRKARVVTVTVQHEETGRTFEWDYEENMSQGPTDTTYPWDFGYDWEPTELFDNEEALEED